MVNWKNNQKRKLNKIINLIQLKFADQFVMDYVTYILILDIKFIRYFDLFN
jgi:hypothetical protein